MRASDVLLGEHAAIERVVGAMRRRVNLVEGGAVLDPHDVDEHIHFLRSYVDRTHCRREEDILFHHLGSRPMTLQHRAWLEEAVDEHELVRRAKSASRAELMQADGTLLLIPLEENRVFSRDSDGSWLLWELPPELSLMPCAGQDRRRT